MMLLQYFLPTLVLFALLVFQSTAYPTEDEELRPEHLKPAFDNTDEEPPMIEVDEVAEEEIEFGDNSDLQEEEVPEVPILVPGKVYGRHVKRSVTDEGATGNTTGSAVEAEEETDSSSTEEENGSELSEEGDEDSEDDESSDEIRKGEGRMKSRSKAPRKSLVKPQSSSSRSVDDETTNDAVVIEACEDYEDTCSSSALTKSDDVACRAYRERCESRESGQFIDTFFCPNSPNGEC